MSTVEMDEGVQQVTVKMVPRAPYTVLATSPGPRGQDGEPGDTPIFTALAAQFFAAETQADARNVIDAPGYQDLADLQSTVDGALSSMVTQINDRAPTAYVNQQDAALQTNIDGKVDKSATPNRVYANDGSGNPTVILRTNLPTATALALRDANGRAQFADPAAAQDAATMNWTTTQISNALHGAVIYVQQDDPETTDPTYTGPAVWYVLDGAGQLIGKRVRA